MAAQGRGIAVPLLARAGRAEVAWALAHAEPSIVMCSEPPTKALGAVFSHRTRLGGDPVRRRLRALRRREPDDVADIAYTSGMTGEPKGAAVLPRRPLLHRPGPGSGGWASASSPESPFATTSGSLLVCGPMRGGLSGWPCRQLRRRTLASPTSASTILLAARSWCRRWWSSSSPRRNSRSPTSPAWRPSTSAARRSRRRRCGDSGIVSAARSSSGTD